MAGTKDLTVTLKYLTHDPKYEVDKPFTCLINLDGVPGAEQSNIVSEGIPGILIKDIRETRNELDLDIHGFEIADVGSQFEPDLFEDKTWMKNVYYPHLVELILKKTGAKEAQVFEHQVPHIQPSSYGDPWLTNDSSSVIDIQGLVSRIRVALDITILRCLRFISVSEHVVNILPTFTV